MRKNSDTCIENEDEEAVSPVIGVILMVAITVILAAVTGTFMMGMSNDLQQNAQLGINPQQYSLGSAGESVNVTLSAVNRADNVYVKGVSVTGTNQVWSDITQGDIGETRTICSKSGCDVTTSSNLGSGDQLNFVAEYNGKNQTVLSYTVN